MGFYSRLYDILHISKNIWNAVIYSEKTVWFCFGMAIEALGLGIQWQFGFPTAPLLDFVVGALFGYGLLYVQNKYPLEEDGDDDEDEDSDADGPDT